MKIHGNGNNSNNNQTDNNTNNNVNNNVENNTNSNINNNTEQNSSIPNNVVLNISKVSSRKTLFRRQSLQIAETRQNPIIINVPLRIDLTYYLWIKDSMGNTRYQTFTISKAIV